MLLEWKNGQIKVIPEVYGIRAFRNVLVADNTPEKSRAMLLFSWLYFVYNPLSEYIFVEDINERIRMVNQDMGMPSNFDPSRFTEAIETYKLFAHSESLDILTHNMKIVEKLKIFSGGFNLNDVDMDKRTASAAQMVKLVRDLNALAVDIEKTKRTIVKEMDEAGSKIVGGHQLSVGDMGVNDDDFTNDFGSPEF